MSSRERRIIAGGFAALAGVLTLTSSAWACAIYKGSMTATNASGSQTVQGAPGWSMWCGGTPPTLLSETGGVVNTISLSVAPGACEGVVTQIQKGRYNVAYAAGHRSQGGLGTLNCDRRSYRIGTMTVSNDGTGSGSYSYTSAAAGTATNICVYSTAVPDANDINIATV